MLKGNKEKRNKSETFDSLWIIKESKKITAGLNAKLINSATFYHAIRDFIMAKQGEAEPNDTFKLIFDNFYSTIEIADGENILRREQLTNNGSQSTEREKQTQIYLMKAMFSLLIAY